MEAYVEYNGKKYPTRNIFLSGYSRSNEFWYGEYTISTENLLKELEKAFAMPIDSEERNHADWIDNDIFFYVPDDIIGAGDNIMSRYIMDNI